MRPHASTRHFWQGRATDLAWRINTAAWLARLAPVTFFVATVFAVGFYGLRRADASLAPAAGALTIALAVAAGGCWWRARPGFFDADEARVLIESHLRLDTRLTAASLGLTAWPGLPARFPPIVQWRPAAPLGWLAAAAGLVMLALVAPVPPITETTARTSAPPSLLQTEAMLAAMKEMNIAEPNALEHLEERARALAQRPTEEQYSHSALEAADALRNQTAVSASELSRNLEAAASALVAADNRGDMDGPAGRLAAALAGLRDGSLPANKELLANLPASAGELNRLTPQQRAELAQQLAKAAKALRGVGGAFGAGVQVAQGDTTGQIGAGTGDGGESAPLLLADQASDAGSGTAQGLTPGEMKRFALGDKLGVSTGVHEVDPGKAMGPGAAGAAGGPASGGDAVWVNRLTPTERNAVKKFFK